MSDIIDLIKSGDHQILPPFKDHQAFERFIVDYFNELENTTSYQRFGSSGQKQFGLDVYSNANKTVIQCKSKDLYQPLEKVRSDLLKDLTNDFAEFQKYNDTVNNLFTRFLLVSTQKNDAQIETLASQLSTEECIVEYWSWIRLHEQLKDKTTEKYSADFIETIKNHYNEEEGNNLDENQTLPTGNLKKDDNGHLLDQLDLLFKKELYAEMEFVPLHVLASTFPIQISGNSYFSLYDLKTDNTNLFTLFKAVKIVGMKELIIRRDSVFDGVKNHKQKLRNILLRLTNNLAFHIQHGQKRIDIRLSDPEECNCVQCQFERLELDKLVPRLKRRRKTTKDLLKLGHINYKLGNYTYAAKNFGLALEQAKKEKKELTIFLAAYNLSKIYHIHRFYHEKSSLSNELFDEYGDLNIDDFFCTLRNTKHKKVIQWLYKETFLHSAEYKIKSLVDKIIQQYYSSLQGGWAHNNSANSLVHEYAKFFLFVQQNQIVYDGFPDYKELCELWAEGIYASNSITAKENDKLGSLNDWILGRILESCRSDVLINHFKRYGRETLHYESTSTKKKRIIEKMITLVRDNFKFLQIAKKSFEHTNKFKEDQLRMIKTAIVLVSQVDFDPSDVKRFAKALINYLKLGARYPELSVIEYFLHRKGQHLDDSTFKSFWIAGFENKYSHHPAFFETLSNVIVEHKQQISLSDDEFKTQLNKLQGHCEFCNKEHESDLIVYFAMILKKQNQFKIVKKLIMNRLEHNFHAELYVFSVIHGIISLNAQMRDKLIDLSERKEDVPSPFKPAYSKEERRYQNITFLLSACYKSGIDTSIAAFNKLRGLNKFYDWLLDMDNFDYKQFNPSWILENRGRYYYKRMSKCQALKEYLEEYFTEKESYYEQEIMNSYINIYVRRSWDVE